MALMLSFGIVYFLGSRENVRIATGWAKSFCDEGKVRTKVSCTSEIYILAILTRRTTSTGAGKQL